MTFTVVIPTKNEADHLPLLLASIKTQTLQPNEIIVADAKSSDSTAIIAEQFRARVVDGGMPATGRNAGAKFAKTDIIIFLDADVQLFDSNFFYISLADFLKQQLDIATCDVLPIKGSRFDRFSHVFYNRYVRLWGNRFPHAPGFCIFVKKSLHDLIGGFDESISFCEDHEYAMRARKKGKFGFINGVSVPVSIRRMDKDGRVNIAIKYVLAEIYLLFFGPIRSDIFSYNFDYSKKKKDDN